jgi:hypothetical protein
MTAKHIDITIEQGTTFNKKINWYGGGLMIREIEGVTTGCPTDVNISAHGLPSIGKTPVIIDDVRGARNLNTKGKEVLATYLDADNFSVPINTQKQVYVTDTGCVHYILPKALTSWTARMDVRDCLDDTVTLVSLKSADGDIVINTVNAEIEIIIDAAVTAALDFDAGVYDLELEDASGNVTRLIEGNVAFTKEVTRP